MTEILDIYDANMQPIGTAEREVVHSEGLWHRTFHCWIVARRHGDSFVLLQLRSPTKKMYPDMLDITAAGHIEAGESSADGIRELNEELGLDTDFKDLVFLGVKHDVADVGTQTKNREFSDVYLLRDDRPLEEYVLQEDEVSGLAEVVISDGLALFSGEVDEIRAKATRISNAETVSFERTIRRDDLIPRVDSYYYKVFIMAERMLDGNPYLAI